MDPVDAVLIGAGQRGANDFGSYALQYPDRLRFVAVAEPIPERRTRFAHQHQIPLNEQYEHWQDLLSTPQKARGALICTQDQMHVEPTLTALRRGYDVLLEKPIATTPEGCIEVIKTAAETGRQLHIGHVLRYTSHFKKLHQIVSSGMLGDLINIDHRENVSWWHMAHSFVRGSWSISSESSPMILAKCCHDFDLLLWILDRNCEHLSSIGHLVHFRPENAPPDAPQRCLDGCPVSEDCPYYAPFVYIDMLPLWRDIADTSTGLVNIAAQAQLKAPNLLKFASKAAPPLRQVSDYRGWPRSVLALEPSPDAILKALRSGPYGRCVYFCGNDVVDHQVVLMKFAGKISVSLTMHGHSHIEGRSTRIEGSRATLKAFFGLGGSWIEIDEHRSDRSIRHDTTADVKRAHGGGDVELLNAFVESLRATNNLDSLSIARQALKSYFLAFAAEEARLGNKIVNMQSYAARYLPYED
ncbi:MAG: Gfo/Idh/MocA family oxidoreductase [Anaerolineaceae bacterium]|nr:MAG: Gfo/Idh/MocA family oxidoreductase [Anaerolineaceae bacterium]